MDSTDPRLELLSKWHAEGLLAKAGFTEGTKSELEENSLGVKYSKGNIKGATAVNTRKEIKGIITKIKKPTQQHATQHHAHNQALVRYVQVVPQGSVPIALAPQTQR